MENEQENGRNRQCKRVKEIWKIRKKMAEIDSAEGLGNMKNEEENVRKRHRGRFRR